MYPPAGYHTYTYTLNPAHRTSPQRDLEARKAPCPATKAPSLEGLSPGLGRLGCRALRKRFWEFGVWGRARGILALGVWIFLTALRFDVDFVWGLRLFGRRDRKVMGYTCCGFFGLSQEQFHHAASNAVCIWLMHLGFMHSAAGFGINSGFCRGSDMFFTVMLR